MRRLAALTLALTVGLAAPAAAHPHVWVTIKSRVLYAPDGTITGVRHAWTFDDMFSAFATQGIAQQTKGVFTREELASLATVNVTSLREYGFFTFAKADGKTVAFTDPKDYWLDYNDAMLTLNFTLPVAQPVAAKDAVFEIYDESYFVAFELAPKDAATLEGAPAECKVSVRPPQELTQQQMQRLNALDASAQNTDDRLGDAYANRIRVMCP